VVRIRFSNDVERRCLEVLGLLTKLGYKDEMMHDTMNIMISKQTWKVNEYWKTLLMEDFSLALNEKENQVTGLP
jgi:hypothetical protein